MTYMIFLRLLGLSSQIIHKITMPIYGNIEDLDVTDGFSQSSTAVILLSHALF